MGDDLVRIRSGKTASRIQNISLEPGAPIIVPQPLLNAEPSGLYLQKPVANEMRKLWVFQSSHKLSR